MLWRSVHLMPIDKRTTDAFIGIEVLKRLYVDGNARISDALEQLFNGEKAEVERVASSVGRAAMEAMNAGR